MGEGFRDLIVWRKAYSFALDIYKISKHFPKDENYGITSRNRQIINGIDQFVN